MATTQLKRGLVSMSLTNATVKNAVRSYTMSTRYIVQMLKAAVINIFYHRLNINKKEFVPKTFKNISFQTPKSKSRNEYIRQYNGYMNACKDAIEKNYLREFYLYFIDADTKEILEHYIFSFKYGNTEETNPSQNAEILSDLTCELLQTLQDFEKHPKLDGRRIEINGELTYFYDTPDEYQPPGFQALDESEAMVKKLYRGGNSVVLCSLYTGFHKLKCRGKGGIFQLNTGSEITPSIGGDEIDIEEHPVLFNEESEETPLDKAQLVPDSDPITVLTEDFSEPVNHEKNKSPESGTSKTFRNTIGNETYLSDAIDVISINSTNDEYAGVFDCPCRIDSKCDDLWSPDIIECSKCYLKCHVACNGYLDKTFFGLSFVCTRCEPTRNHILDTNVFGFECRVRYLLACMYKLSRMPTELEQMFEDQGAMSFVKKRATVHTNDENNGKPRIAALAQVFNFDHKKPDFQKAI